MPNTTQLAHKISDYLGMTLNLDADRQEIIQYSLDIFLASLVNIVLVLIIAYLLGVTRYAVIALITSSVLRYFSGGAHCSSSGRCIVAGSVTIPLFGFAAKAFADFPVMANPSTVKLIYFVIAAFSMVSILLWSPADTPGKPISTKLARDTLRRNSFLCAFFIEAIILYHLFAFPLSVYNAEIYAALIGITWQSLSISPIGYTAIHRLDTALQFIGIY